MKADKFWISVQIRKGDKYSAAVIPVSNYDNIYSKLSGIPGIVAANIYSTNKAAVQTVNAWVSVFRSAGVFLYDTIPDYT